MKFSVCQKCKYNLYIFTKSGEITDSVVHDVYCDLKHIFYPVNVGDYYPMNHLTNLPENVISNIKQLLFKIDPQPECPFFKEHLKINK